MSCVRADPVGSVQTLKVVVVGGGPVGLCFALMLQDALGQRAEISVHEQRWSRQFPQPSWKGEAEGNRRRRQVITLQSELIRDLPADVQGAILAMSSVMWPLGRASPAEVGPPRNIRIAEFEDGLLRLAIQRGIRLVAERFDPAAFDLSGTDILVISDGARSPTREYFSRRFGPGDATSYSCDGQPFEDVVLALGVHSDLPTADGVLLTVTQNRFLLNVHRGEGVLNMRLTRGEAAELRTINPEGGGSCECMGRQPCTLLRSDNPDGSWGFTCPRHGSVFRPSVDRLSMLWPRIVEGLKLFGVPEDGVSSLSLSRIAMVDRPRFTVQLAPARAGGAATYGFLLGDAANAIHHWPGRGLNSGLHSAVSLARCLASRWKGAQLRQSDFARHEGNMHMLQYRQKARAWAAVARVGSDGRERPIAEDIRAGQISRQPAEQARAILRDRLVSARGRLVGRLDDLPDDPGIEQLLDGMSEEMLRTFVASGPWDTWQAGGEEVDIGLTLPLAEDAPVAPDLQLAPDLPAAAMPPREARPTLVPNTPDNDAAMPHRPIERMPALA